MKKILKNGLAAFVVSLCGSLLLTGCFLFPDPRIASSEDLALFHQKTSQQGHTLLQVDKQGRGGAAVDLYVDYSDCMNQSTGDGSYYKKVQPALDACNPSYYSIKDSVIKFETKNPMDVHNLLNSITEVNYSDFKKAAGMIVNNNHEAILITDGEYYLQRTGPNLNNPYLADEFKIWLKKGLDVYVYCEPYESKDYNKATKKSESYTKNRYYMLFTDHRIPNNIQEIFSRIAPKDDNVSMVHLYSGLPIAEVNGEYVRLNQYTDEDESVRMKGNGFEYRCLEATWEDMYNYILAEAEDDNGNPIPGGEIFMDGIDISTSDIDAYKADEMEVVAYEISNVYSKFLQAPSSKRGNQNIKLGQPLKNMFILDADAWKSHKIALKFHPKFDGSCLGGVEGNYVRVDIRVKKSVENFTNNKATGTKFIFNSVYGTNTSVFESLKQTLTDPSISPEESGNTVVYSIYLDTFAN